MKNHKTMSFPEKLREQLSLLSMLLLAFSFVMTSCDIIPNNEEDDDNNTAGFVDKYEPNDERSEAYAIDLDTMYHAEIGETTDDDWFRISPAHGSDTYDLVQISLSGVSTELYIHMELYALDGSSVASLGATTQGQDLTYTLATPGIDYYVRFSGWDGYVNDHKSSGRYSFTVSNMNANDDFAPNHTIATAAESLEYDHPYAGVIVSKYEADYYKFTNPKPGVWNSYTFTLSKVSDDLCGMFSRYGPDKSELDYIGSRTAGADLSYSFVSKDEVFYIRVSGWDGYVNDNKSSGSYTLTAVCKGNDDYEPDDTFEDARAITSFPTQLTGTVLIDAANDNDGDYEFFKVTINEGKKVNWSVSPEAANTELHFNVYDANRQYFGMVDGDRGQTINGSMNNPGGVESYIYIKLGAFVGDNGHYSISFTETNAD